MKITMTAQDFFLLLALVSVGLTFLGVRVWTFGVDIITNAVDKVVYHRQYGWLYVRDGDLKPIAPFKIRLRDKEGSLLLNSPKAEIRKGSIQWRLVTVGSFPLPLWETRCYQYTGEFIFSCCQPPKHATWETISQWELLN